MTEDEMVGILDLMDVGLSRLWELVCCSPRARKESDKTEQLN